MHRYSVYGCCLVSEVEFPQLLPTNASTDEWVLRVSKTPLPPHPTRLLGEETVAGIRIRLLKHEAGFRVEHEDTGAFDVSPDGRELLWHPGPDVNPDILCADVTGRVIATALHPTGRLVLHGSSVVMPEGGITFLAPKGHGKSTLAMSMTAAGAQLASDDMAIVDLTDPVMGWPGLGTLRLWGRTAEALGVSERAKGFAQGGKVVVNDLPAHMRASERYPQAAIYVLVPATALPDPDLAAHRVRLEPVEAALALVPHTKLGPLLAGAEAPVVLERAARVARSVPVYRLYVLRDLERISDVVNQLFEWHAAPAACGSAFEDPLA